MTRRRLVGAAALLVGLAIPAAVTGQAYTTFYGFDAYTTYRDPYSGSSVQTVRPFWDFLGVFQRPVSGGSTYSAGYGSPGVYRASYAPGVTTASYGRSYSAGYGYQPVSSYYGGEIVTGGSTYGGSFYESSYAGGALPYGSTTSYSTYGSSCEPVNYGNACRSVPACSPCSDPCGGACPGGNCTSYSVPDDRIYESDPVIAVPRERRDREPRPERDPQFDERPTERPRRDNREDSVRDPNDEFPNDELFPEGDFSGGRTEDPRPTGSPFDDPTDDNDFGGLDDPLTGAGAGFGDEPSSGILPAEGVEPFRRRPSEIVDPPGERTRPVPRNDTSFETDSSFEFEALPDTSFDGAAPRDGATPGAFGANPGGLDGGNGQDERFGGNPDLLGRPGDGSFPERLEREPAFGDDIFSDDGGAFGNDPDANRQSFRLSPNEVDLTGPPAAEGEDDAPIPAELSAPTDVDSTQEEMNEDRDDAGGDAPVWDPETDAAEPADGGAGASDAAAAEPQLITAELLRAERQRTRVANPGGRTRIARFRHRPVDPASPSTPADVQIAAQ